MDIRNGIADKEIKYEKHDALINMLFLEIKKINATLAAIEIRQNDMQNLLQDENVQFLIQNIPTEQSIKNMFQMIEHHPFSDIRESIDSLREYLQEMVDRFTF